MRRGNWKLLVNPDRSRAELYDLAADERESTNLAAEQPGMVEELTALVMAWRATWPRPE